eukprot:2481775-Lingulodinium_polyedra.AAC.1
MRQGRKSLEGDPSPGWDDQKDGATTEVVGSWSPVVAGAIAEGRIGRAMAAFEAAADEWLWRRLGRDGEPAERPAPAQWRAPAPRQTGAAGEAADREADAALLK